MAPYDGTTDILPGGAPAFGHFAPMRGGFSPRMIDYRCSLPGGLLPGLQVTPFGVSRLSAPQPHRSVSMLHTRRGAVVWV